MSQQDIYEVLKANEGEWMNSNEIYDAIKKKGSNISKSTVGVNLQRISRMEIIEKKKVATIEKFKKKNYAYRLRRGEKNND